MWKRAFMSLLRSPWSVVASGEGQLRCFMHCTSYQHLTALLHFLSQLAFKEMRKTKQTCIFTTQLAFPMFFILLCRLAF